MRRHMNKKYLAAAALALTLAAANSLTAFAAGWVHTPQGYKYQHGDGSDYRNSWLRENDQWYYFGDVGIMRTGWVQRDNTWYFASDTGELNEGIMKINGNVYKFAKDSCTMVIGASDYHGVTYTFTENGTGDRSPYVYNEWNSNGTLAHGQRYVQY